MLTKHLPSPVSSGVPADEAAGRTTPGLQLAHLVRSIAHSLECPMAVFYRACDQDHEVCASFGIAPSLSDATEPAAATTDRFLAEASRLAPDGMLVVNDLLREPGFCAQDVAALACVMPGLRFVAAAQVNDAHGTSCGVLVVADTAPHAGLSAAKSYVLLTHAAQLAALLELQRLRLASQDAPATATRSSSTERLRLLESVVVNANDAVLITSAEPIDLPGPRIVYCNAAFTRTTGYSEAEVLGRTPRLLQSAKTSRRTLDKLRRALTRWKPVEVELLNRHKDGREFWVELSIVPVTNEVGWFTHWVSVQRDVSDRKAAEETATRARIAEAENVALEAEIRERKHVEARLLHTAFHDDLTKLRNRAFFMDRLTLALVRGRSDPASRCAVLFLDLDRFKLVNDSLGHRAGDLLLMEIAERLRSCTSPQDTIARVGGDEFALLVEDFAEVTDLVRLARRIIEAMRRPMWIGDQEIFSSCSVGVVQAGPQHTQPEELLRDADIAMYQAKRHDTGNYAIFADSMHDDAVRALELQTDLQHAILRGEFVLHYQPICRSDTSVITGFEALIRWNHPQRGLVQPGDFIAAAEETGLIRDIGRWVLREAAVQMRLWHDCFPGLALRLSINASAEELKDPGFVVDMRSTLAATGLDPCTLQIEVTEGVFIRSPEIIDGIIGSIRELGVRIALDDFGTGYSSLGYLDRYPLDTLKIDRSFVACMLTRPRTRAIVNAIIQLGLALDLEIVAEGVEEAAQLQTLIEAGCGSVQGYLLGRPLPVEQADAALARQAAAAGAADAPAAPAAAP